MQALPRLLPVVLILFLPGRVHAQPTPASRLAAIQAAYQQLDYERAKALGEAALQDYDAFTPAQLTEIHTLLGLVYFSENEPEAARLQFEAALSLTPDLSLDPLLVSPKILAFFEEVKRNWQQRQAAAEAGIQAGAIRYVRLEDPRPAAALRSFVLPGWGQLYKGDRTKGWLLMAGWGVAVTGTLVAHVRRNQARDAYLAERDPDRITDRYDTFNTWHKARNNLALAASALWVLSYLDALVFRPPAPARATLALRPGFSASPPALHISVRF
ncbi:MAG: hypothetical protein D6746_07920 [Bacteroidetes bacterium]|nr:MAG: hypothetical protein D6746_07920 [Bacteroidota bacterium]